MAAGCGLGRKPEIKIESIETKSIDKLLTSKGILFEKKDTSKTNQFDFDLIGEDVDSSITTIYNISYSIDWKKETAYPNVYYYHIPLKYPQFLTDINQNIKILVAGVGNDQAIDERELRVFDNDQVMNLKEKLDKKYGSGKMVKEDSYTGKYYIWMKEKSVIRLTITNECLCEDARMWSGDERPKSGRYGQLTIYYDIDTANYMKQFKSEL